ncbi:MAG: ribonuclease H family protein [Parabacteroides sp.]|nr:ribonuclease H family protein [Parabacteroides sp.]
MAKNKYYVVWNGRVPGVYDTWEACKAQVENEAGAKYKSFDTEEKARDAFEKGYSAYAASTAASKAADTAQKGTSHAGLPDKNSVAVDAACSGNPGDMEYRGVFTATGEELFRIGPFREGTNNIGEFLAIVHGLALLKQKGSRLPLYSDSRNAILWVKNKKCKTQLARTSLNEPVFNLIARAEKWLNENSYTTPILKWETAEWGEIPADFGRK